METSEQPTRSAALNTVADILDILSDNDWECGEREHTYEAHAPVFDALDLQAVYLALIVARILSCDPVTTVQQLAGIGA